MPKATSVASSATVPSIDVLAPFGVANGPVAHVVEEPHRPVRTVDAQPERAAEPVESSRFARTWPRSRIVLPAQFLRREHLHERHEPVDAGRRPSAMCAFALVGPRRTAAQSPAPRYRQATSFSLGSSAGANGPSSSPRSRCPVRAAEQSFERGLERVSHPRQFESAARRRPRSGPSRGSPPRRSG